MIKQNSIYGDIKFTTRKNSPSDELVIKEIFDENVYRVHDNMIINSRVVLDIGANIGVFTLDMLRRAKNNGKPIKIYAVEPEPHNIKILKKNIKNNPGFLENSEVIIVNLAIGDENKTVKISNDHGGSRISDDGAEVEMVTLDEFIKRYNIKKVDFAKFDIEGSEVPTILSAPDGVLDIITRTAIEFDEQNGLDDFAKIMVKFGRNCSISTWGVPSRGCYIYTERSL